MNESFMKQAIELAKEHSAKLEGGPFGAVIVKDGKIIGEGWNTVLGSNDPTAHAEVNAIRNACKNIGSYDLTGCEIYSTTEPCPMCLASIYWARLDSLYFGNGKDDAARIGFDDAFIYEEFEKDVAERRLKTTSGVLSDDVNNLFSEWEALDSKTIY